LVCSARLHRSHNVSWKGRKYGSSPGDDNESRITRQQLRRSGI
jgi:hypothetical protein